MIPDDDAARLAVLERENRKLREINNVLMDRVETDLGAQGGTAFSSFQAAIVLESRVTERTAELSRLTQQLRAEIAVRRAAEQALLAAKAQAEAANLGKTRFLAAAGHDLRQPLNAARLLLARLEEAHRQRDWPPLIERISGALDSVEDLLGTLLDISQLDSGGWPTEISTFALGPLLARLAEEYRPQAEAVGLTLRTVPSRAVVRTDRRLLERVVRNFLSNAIRYTGTGRVLLGCRHRGTVLAIEVLDTGIGIDPAQEHAIFEEFHRLGNAPRAAETGLGLGLAIVERIARLLDLTLGLVSTPGRGSKFSVAVPLGDGADLAPMATGPGLAGLRVALVDDDPEVLLATQGLLEAWGCVVAAASSAAALLARPGPLPEIIVADYHLADGHHGTAAIRQIRDRAGTELPALVISGHRSPALEEAVAAAGARFLPKPVAPARLRAMLGFLAGR